MTASSPILALQCDPLSTLNLSSDSSLFLAFEAQQRGMQVFVYTPDALSLTVQDGYSTCFARGVFIKLSDNGRTYTIQHETLLPLNQAHVLLIRQDPPFDTHYISNLYILEAMLKGNPTRKSPITLNHPGGIRHTCEKTLPLMCPHYVPDTLISDVVQDLYEFSQNYDSVIIKPLLGHGGHGVLHLMRPTRAFLENLLPFYTKNNTGPLVMQRYITNAPHGDKRVIMVGGRIVCAFRRIPQQHDPRANLCRGGTAQPCDLSAREVEICEHLAPYLNEHGIYLAGVDVLDEYLIEVNVTSPTGLRTAQSLYNLNIPALFWDGVLNPV